MWTKFGRLVQNDMWTAIIMSKSKPEVRVFFSMADVCFSKLEVIISQPWIKVRR